MPRYDSVQGAIALLVLKILVRRGPTHGYGIASCIEAMSDEVLSVEEGSLYPALHRMEESGWIKARWKMTEKKRRARVYQITAAGRKQLAAEEARWQTVTSAIGRILKHV